MWMSKMVYNIRTICLEFTWLLTFVHVTSGSLNLGLISGDLKRTSNPLIIRKSSHHSPITINIKPGLPNPLKLTPPLLPSKLSSKPSLAKAKIKSRLKSALRSKKLRLPKLPKLPLLPLIPPILPPLIPKLPLLKLPILPRLPRLRPALPKLSKLMKPLRIPILKKSRLQKALSSELKPVKVPVPKVQENKLILNKLVKLRNSGSLTTPEFLRFKKLLL